MDSHVATHVKRDTQDKQYVSALRAEMSETFPRLENSPRLFNIALSEAVTHAQARSLVDPHADQAETWASYVAAMQVGSALFTSVTANTMSLCRIDGKLQEIPSGGVQYYASAANWLTSFWLCAVCRDHDRMARLRDFPIDLLREAGADGYDEYIYHWIDTLQAFLRGEPSTAEKLTSTIDLSYPHRATIADRDLMDKILYQPINLFYRLFRGDSDAFNDDLTRALEYHKEYWTADDERSDSVEGNVALGPLAIACIAHDSNMPITVDSEYIPKHLVDGSWVGSIET